MATFTPAENIACQRLVTLALEEDLGSRGDVTSQAVIPEDQKGKAVFVARSEGVLAGLPAVVQVLKILDGSLELDIHVGDGTRLQKGDRLATVSGLMRSILAAERTALNFLQHLSGIASMTRRYVDTMAGFPAKILDTRKTLPGWRLLEKYAVRCGGGYNHRLGLFDGILIKDNHVAALQGTHALEKLLARIDRSLPLEIEVDTLEQLDAVFICRPNMVLLDNMSTDQLRAAVLRRNQVAPGILLEASGGVNLQTVRAIAETGVDRISVGALTHSAPALDIALDYES